MTKLAPRLDSLTDDFLLARVADLVGRSRRVEAELVWHLAEVDRRGLYLREACPSMHVYATARLHLSDAEAYFRITAARLCRRFPLVLEMLADGRLHLTAIAKMAPHLREDNAEALLGRAAHRSKREIELLVAELAPRPDVPSRMRRMPAPPDARATVGADQLVPARVCSGEVAPAATGALAGSAQAGSASVVSATTGSGRASAAMHAAPASVDASAPSRRAVIAPISPARYRVQFTASAELHDKIEHARAMLRHQIPDGDLGAVFDRAMTLLVRELERARFAATNKPRKAVHEVDPTPSSRDIPDPIKRAVWVRDREQCTFRDCKGRRCSGRERLEFHHLVPFALGGDHSLSNVTLRCAAHNAYQANLDFGAAFMDRKRRGSRAGERHAAARPPVSSPRSLARGDIHVGEAEAWLGGLPLARFAASLGLTPPRGSASRSAQVDGSRPGRPPRAARGGPI